MEESHATPRKDRRAVGVPAMSRPEARVERAKCARSRGLFVCCMMAAILIIVLLISILAPTESGVACAQEPTGTPVPMPTPGPHNAPRGRWPENDPRLRLDVARSSATGARSAVPSSAEQRFSTPLASSFASGVWPLYMHDPAHTQYHPDAGLSLPLTHSWSFEASGNDPYPEAPVVVDETVYVSFCFEDEPSQVYALDAATGDLKWSREITGYTCYSSPAVADDLLYIGTGVCGFFGNGAYEGGYVYALDTATGEIVWERYFVGRADTVPVVANGRVYVVTYYFGQILYALDALTGETIWSYAPAEYGSFAGNPIVVGDRVIYFTGEQIVAVDAETGDFAWQTDFFSDEVRLSTWYWDLAGSEETSYVYVPVYSFYAAPFHLCAINVNSGAIVWTNDLAGSESLGAGETAPVVANGQIYVQTWTSTGMDLYIVDAGSGATLDHHPIPHEYGDHPHMVMADGLLFTSTNQFEFPVVYALNPDSGEVLWNSSILDPCIWPAAAANGRLYVSSYDYGLLSFSSPGLWVDVSVSPGTTLTLTAEGWPTPNPLAVTVTMGNNLTTTVEGLEVQFSLEGSAPPRLYVIPEDGHGEGEYSNGNYYEEWPIGNLAAGEVISTVWSVWVQPSTALTLNCWADLYVDAEWVDEGSEEVSIPQASIHPVIVIPGMLGSWKVNAAGEWAIEPLYGIYDPLLDELEAAGYEDGVTLFPFPYDWKRSNSSTAVLLMDEIAAILSSPAVPYVDYSQVDLVGHSQGTMVARFYVQRYWGEDTVSKFISLAGPFRGAPMAYVAWEGLDPSVMPPEIATPLGFLVRLWAVKAGYGHWIWIWVPLPPPFPPGILVPIPIVSDPELYNYAHNEIPSLGQVLPSDDYLPEYLQDSQGTPFPYGPEPGHEVNTFLNDLNGDVSTTLVDRLGPGNIIAFVGNITDTQEFYEVVPQPPDLAPLWEYGMPEDHNYSAHLGSGDGTVPLISADLSTLDSRVITVSAAGYDYVDHVGIAQYAQNKVIEYLTGIERAANWDDAGLTPDTQQGDLALIIYNLCPVDLVVTDPAGRRVGTDLSTAKSVNEVSGAFYSGHSPDDRDPELIVIHNPLQGPYTISVRGTDKGPYSVGVQLISGPQSINLGTFTGEAVPGEISTFTVEYPAQERPYTARYALRYRGVEYIADTLVVHDPLTVGGLHEDRVQARRESPATSDEKTPDILPMVVYYQVYTLDPLRLNVLAVRVESEKGTQMVEVAQSHQVDKDGTIRFRAKSADEKVPLEVMGEFIFGKERKP